MMGFFGGGGLVGGGAAPAAPPPAAAADAPPPSRHHHHGDQDCCGHDHHHHHHPRESDPAAAAEPDSGDGGSEHSGNSGGAVPCWICLEAGGGADGDEHEMLLPCKCPRPVHPKCLARWQLQSAGKTEETRCRFCEEVLPDWRGAFTPPDLAPAVPVMSIHFNDSTYWLQVHPGADGLERFKGDVRKLLGLTDDQAFDITFECKVPGSGSRMELRGLSAFDAAVYCASITAAERVKTKAPAGAAGAAGKGDGVGGARAGAASAGSAGGLLGPALSSLPSTAIGVGMYDRSGSATDDENEGPLQHGGASGSSSLPTTEEDGDDGSGGADADAGDSVGRRSWSPEEAPVPAAPQQQQQQQPRPSVTDKLLAPVRSWAMRLARPL